MKSARASRSVPDRPAAGYHDAASPAPDGAFLGVEHSATGRAWRLRPAPEALRRRLQAEFGLGTFAASILAGRAAGVGDPAAFLRPMLRDAFPEPSTFAGMDEAAAIIWRAVAQATPTAVFADYDVDGATSAAQLIRWFRHFGQNLDLYVPDRLAEGYGPSIEAFRALHARGVKLIIAVDCGTNAHDPVNWARAKGMQVVIVDHHLSSAAPARADALVNPNVAGCPSGMGMLTAAGVTMVLMAALNRTARAHGRNDVPDLTALVDLAALGTVCDVAPILGFNRAMVARAVRMLADGKGQPGVRALAAVAGLKTVSSADALGWVLGPRLNAGGRIGRSDLATRLLATDDESEASALAAQLHDLNAHRREIQDEAMAAATADARAQGDVPVIVVGRPEFHPGVIGIMAGRLKELLGRPVLVAGGGVPGGEPAKLSGRSIPGVDLGTAVARAASEGAAQAGGGHAMACGATVAWEGLDAFRAHLMLQLGDAVSDAREAARTIQIDALVSAAAFGDSLADDLARFEPYGTGFAEPLLALTGVRGGWGKEMSGGHVRVVLEDATGRVRAVAFRARERGLAALLLSGAPVNVVGRLRRSEWNGRHSIECEIEDVSPATG